MIAAAVDDWQAALAVVLVAIINGVFSYVLHRKARNEREIRARARRGGG